uniref:Uncharacterized protein n=1 Tax=Moniliophthora roreri TaxID=221103 RepID=A0A0W0G1A1_MONRR
MARNCPRNNTFKANSKKGPSGVSTNSLRYSLKDEDVTLSETTQTSDLLSLNSLSFSGPLISDEEMDELFSNLLQTPSTPVWLPVAEELSRDLSEDDSYTGMDSEDSMPPLQEVSETESDWSDDSDLDESFTPQSYANSIFEPESDEEYYTSHSLPHALDT